MSESILRKKSFDLAIMASILSKQIQKERNFPLSDQLFRSGTSVGANIEEAQGGCSRKEFVFKLSIAIRECRETNYWLRIAKHTIAGIDTAEIEKLNDEVMALLTSSLKTVKSRSGH